MATIATIRSPTRTSECLLYVNVVAIFHCARFIQSATQFIDQEGSGMDLEHKSAGFDSICGAYD